MEEMKLTGDTTVRMIHAEFNDSHYEFTLISGVLTKVRILSNDHWQPILWDRNEKLLVVFWKTLHRANGNTEKAEKMEAYETKMMASKTETKDCEVCDGTGIVPHDHPSNTGGHGSSEKCQYCQ